MSPFESFAKNGMGPGTTPNFARLSFKERDISILPINDDPDDWSRAMIRYNLLPNDAIIAATCLKHEIAQIATFDSDFLRVDWLKVIGQNQ